MEWSWPVQPYKLSLSKFYSFGLAIIVGFLGCSEPLICISHSCVCISHGFPEIFHERNLCFHGLLGWSCNEGCWQLDLACQHCKVWGHARGFMYGHPVHRHQCGQPLWPVLWVFLRSGSQHLQQTTITSLCLPIRFRAKSSGVRYLSLY